jgi:predicted transcriptional regulator
MLMSKAIVEIPRRGEYFQRALEVAALVDAGQAVPEADYYLGYSTAAQLFGALTPVRMALLEALKGLGPVSIETLAGYLGRSETDVHADTLELLDLRLVEKTAAGLLWVPWEEIQIRVNLCGAQAA